MQEAPIAPLIPAASPGPITGEPLQTQPGSVNTGQYDWTSADGAVTFLASKTLLEELRAAAYRAKFGSRRAGVEIGGVLYGRRAPSGVELQGWAPIGCGWAYGPSFRLTSVEQGTLACLLDGLAEQLQAEGNEVLGWFVSRIGGEQSPKDSDIELHRQFFAAPGSLLLVLYPSREGDVRVAIHAYQSESQQLAPCEPPWLIAPGPIPVVDKNPTVPSPVRRQRRRRASTAEPQQRANGAVPQSPSSAGTETQTKNGPVDLRSPIPTAPRPQRNTIWDSVPHDVWRLLALSIILAIGGAAWLWLFHADVVRPLLLRWTSSASPPPRSVALTATWDNGHVTVEWDGRSPVFLNPASSQLVFEFASLESTTVPLRPDEAQSGYFTTLSNVPPIKVTMIVTPVPGREFKETFAFPEPEKAKPEPATAAPATPNVNRSKRM